MQCAEFVSLIEDYLEGELDQRRVDDLLSHLEVCSACAKSFRVQKELDRRLTQYYHLQAVQAAAVTNPLDEAPPASVAAGPPPRRALWLGVAAAVVLVVLVLTIQSIYRDVVPRKGDAILGRVMALEGTAIATDEQGQMALIEPGDGIGQNQRVKASNSAYLAIALADGAVLEARGGTQLTLLDFPNRLEVALNRGQVWAHLRTRPEKSFVIQTPHLKASAIGTVFSVEQGLDRSVVLVADGMARVEYGGAQTDVQAGETYNSKTGLGEDVAPRALDWSRYPESLASLTNLQNGEEIDPLIAPVEPEDTASAVSASQQGLAGDLAEYLPDETLHLLHIRDIQTIIAAFENSDYQALAREASIHEWLESSVGSEVLSDMRRHLCWDEVSRLLPLLQGQVVVTASSGGRLLALADCGDNAGAVDVGLDAIMERLAPDYLTESERAERLEDMRRYLFVAGSRLIVSNDPDLADETARRIVADRKTDFSQSRFYHKVRQDLSADPLFFMAFNLNGQIRDMLAGVSEDAYLDDINAMLDFWGLSGLDTFVVSPHFAGRGMSQAARLNFLPGSKYGVMSWLGDPAPMRGLDFFSPDVHLFGSFIIARPEQMVADYLTLLDRTETSEALEGTLEFIADNSDIFDSLGGEIAVGLDSPILPVPNLKVVVELSDPQTFGRGLDALVQRLQIASEQRGVYILVELSEFRGRLIYSLVADEWPIRPSWAIVDDFFVFGPGPQFVQNSIAVRESGASIASDARLLSLLPQDMNMNLSCLVYQDVVRAVPTMVAESMGSAGQLFARGVMPDLSFMERYRAPGIAFAYARPDSIDLYFNTPNGIDHNLRLTAPMVARWLAPRLSVTLVLTRVAEAQAGLEDLRQAAQRYRAEHGVWPPELGALEGAYIDRVPNDPFGAEDGEPLRLAHGPTEGQILLYSIGPDGVDDGGQMDYDFVAQYDGPGDIVIRLPEAEAALAAQDAE